MYRCFFTILMLLVFGSPLYAQPATRTLAGTVTYKGERKGRIYITARNPSYNFRGSSAYETSIPEPGAFEIRGVSVDEEYEVIAVMAVDGSVSSVSAPVAPTVIVYPGDAGTSLALGLQDPKGAFCAPPDVVAYPQEGGILVYASSSSACNNSMSPNGLVIHWSTDENFRSGYGISSGLVTIPSATVEAFFGTKKGNHIFIRAASQVEGAVGPFSIPIGPFDSVGAPEGRAVEGTVTIPKKYVGRKVIIFGTSPKETHAVMLSASSTSFKYRIGGFTDFPPSVHGFVDLDGNGVRDVSDPYLTGESGGWTVDLALAKYSKVAPSATTETVFVSAMGNRYLGFADWYELCFAVRPGVAVLAGATVMSGPGISSPVDMSFAPKRWYSNCNANVTVPNASAGDSYTIRLEYLDGRIETQTAVVTGIADFMVPIEPLGLLSDLQDQIFTWNRGNSVLTNSPYFYGSSDGNVAWLSTFFLPLGNDRYFLPEALSQTEAGRNSWTIENRDNVFGSISRVTAPYYYGTGGVAAVAVDRNFLPVSGVTARLEDLESRAVVAEKAVENGEVTFNGVVPGRYRFCFEGADFPLQCMLDDYPYYYLGINVFVGETSYPEFTLFRKDDWPSLPAEPLVLNEGKEVTTTAEIPVSITNVDINGDPLLIRYRWDDSYRGWWDDVTPSIVKVPSSGRHTLYVEFRNSAGRITGSAASIVLDNIPPVALFDKKPDPSAETSSCSFTLRQGDVVGYRAALDGGELSDEIPVTQPFERTGLSYGMHTLSVVGRDAAGNWQLLPSEYVWKVDVPTAAIGLQETRKAWIATVQGEGVTMYRYRMGNGKYSDPRPVSKTFTVRKNYTGAVSVVGRSANGTWQKLPSVTQIPPATL